MVLCSIDYVRSKIFTSSLTDLDISNIISETSEDILTLCETTDETNPLIILAGKYAILAAVLRKMKTTGEMAASVKTESGAHIRADRRLLSESHSTHIRRQCFNCEA